MIERLLSLPIEDKVMLAIAAIWVVSFGLSLFNAKYTLRQIKRSPRHERQAR